MFVTSAYCFTHIVWLLVCLCVCVSHMCVCVCSAAVIKDRELNFEMTSKKMFDKLKAQASATVSRIDFFSQHLTKFPCDTHCTIYCAPRPQSQKAQIAVVLWCVGDGGVQGAVVGDVAEADMLHHPAVQS